MIAILTALLLTIASQAEADCDKLCDRDLWKTATKADLQAELDAGADPKVKDGLNKEPWLYAQFNKRLKYVEDYWPLLIRSIN